MIIRQLTILLVAAASAGALPHVAPPAIERAVPNDNRRPAGRMQRDTLVLRLKVTPAAWHILAERDSALRVLAFAEEGKSPSIPGPLIRARVGTPVRVRVRNPLDDTLVVRGFSERAATLDSLVVLPGDTASVTFVLRNAGTYLYWVVGANLRLPANLRATRPMRRGFDWPLAGAIVVDPPGAPSNDRVFVITMIGDIDRTAAANVGRDRHGTPLRVFSAINGKAWPYTERLRYAVGDTVRWRIVNASQETHPMHLHGFYFRVDAHGTPQATADSIYTSEQRRMVVTEPVGVRNTVSIVWSPERVGGWLFHCHITSHAVRLPPVGRPEEVEFPSAHHHGDPDQHAVTGMGGLVLGVTVSGRSPVSKPSPPARQLRLFVQSDSAPGDLGRRFGYVLQRGEEPGRDSVEYPGPLLVLTRGEPTTIEIINRSGEPTAVHWHGIELESYFDGVAGWSGTRNRIAPAIRSNGSFEVRITPPRAGTFMYHTHFDELRQQYGGLVGPLVVLEPGEKWDAERNLLFLFSDGVPQRLFVNGSLTPPPRELEVGKTYRLRIAHIAVFRLTMQLRLVRDSTLMSWRPVAKDGFTLPPPQDTLRPSTTNVLPGETADFEFTPDRAGDVFLVVAFPNRAPEATVRLRVSSPR